MTLKHDGMNFVLCPKQGNTIVHFTVAGGNKAGVDLVLIQPLLLCYVNHVVLMLTSII